MSSTSTYSYDWQACNSAGAGCTSIQNGAAASLVLTTNQLGETIKVGVTANNGQASAEVFSALSGVIAAAVTTPATTPPATTPPAVQVMPTRSNTAVTSAPRTISTTQALSASGQAIKLKVVKGTTIVLQLILDKKTARAVGLGKGKANVIVGQVTIRNAKTVNPTVKVIMTRKARRALSKLRRTFKLTLRTTFLLSGHVYVVNRVETVNRPKPKERKHR